MSLIPWHPTDFEHLIKIVQSVGAGLRRHFLGITIVSLPFIPFVVGSFVMRSASPSTNPLTVTSITATSGTFNTPTFSFDTSNTRSINTFTNVVGDVASKDECFIEERATIVNLGITNANCHVVYIPALGGVFGSNNALQVNATQSSVRNASGQGAGKLNASGGLETCRSITPFAQCWGTTLYAADTGGAVGVLNGLYIAVLQQNPVANYTGAASNPNGITIQLSNAANAGTIGTGVAISKFGSARWNVGFQTADSGAAFFAQAGALGTQASQNSQPFTACYRDGSATSICRNILQLDFVGNNNLSTGLGGATGGFSTNINNSFLLVQGGIRDAASALVCGAATTPAIDVRAGDYFTCNITANVAVVVAVPTANPTAGQGQEIVVALRNGSGGALTTAPTFNIGAGGFKFAGGSIVNPGNGTQVLYTWRFDQLQGFWYLTAVSGAL